MTSTAEFGNWAEYCVAQYLKNKGYVILERNYKKRWGEIDIIAEKEGVTIFVEVKANKTEAKGFEPENRINSEKLRRLSRVIQTYIAYKKFSPEKDWQVDVVSFILDRSRGVAKIKHFKNIEI